MKSDSLLFTTVCILNDENWQELVPQASVDLITEINGVERLKNLSVKEVSDL